MATKFEAILAINPNATFETEVVDGEEIVTWTQGMTPISDNDIQAKIVELNAQWIANKYQRDRRPKYPSIQDQLDMMYHDKVNGTSTWQDAIAKVKSDFPKA